MLRLCPRVIALSAMIVGVSTAQAAEPETLTLACQGTTTSELENAKPEPVSMGIIVNFTNRTVQGFGYPGLNDYPVKITAWDDVFVMFEGSEDHTASVCSVIGNIDRVTGDVQATFSITDAKTGKLVTSTSYVLKCRPAQRMF